MSSKNAIILCKYDCMISKQCIGSCASFFPCFSISTSDTTPPPPAPFNHRIVSAKPNQIINFYTINWQEVLGGWELHFSKYFSGLCSRKKRVGKVVVKRASIPMKHTCITPQPLRPPPHTHPPPLVHNSRVTTPILVPGLAGMWNCIPGASW